MNWKYKIGENIKNERNDIIIIDKKIQKRKTKIKGKEVVENRKYYKYICNKCGYDEGWKEEQRIQSKGCPCCTGNIAVKGINTFADKRPDLLIYIKNRNEAYEHTVASNHVTDMICPVCKSERRMSFKDISRQGFSCNKCGDHISYPEKFMMSFLEQLNFDYIYQFSKKHAKWCGKYRYDFYIEEKDCIIETNGEQHYKKGFTFSNAKSLMEIREIDLNKKKLALENDIQIYIKINCEKSNLEVIKNGILNSGIIEALDVDLSKVDFKRCAIDANRNIMKEVCDFYNLHPEMTPPKIAPLFRVDRVTILDYLKRGAELGLCDYDVEEAKTNARIDGLNAARDKISKRIAAYTSDGVYIGEFKNASVVVEYFKENYGILLCCSSVNAVCNERYKQHKGYKFKYI